MNRSVPPVELELLGGCQLRCHGEPVHLPLGAQRLLCYLALRAGGASRPIAAETLWPHRQGGRAAANLRTALWQTRWIDDVELINCCERQLQLSAGIRVDLHQALCCAHTVAAAPAQRVADPDATIRGFARELLPDWSDDWLLFERERWDQVRLHALEILARHLIAVGLHLPALEAALTAVAIEPLRESANRSVMEAHIAEGNTACAVQRYQRYRDLLQRELGVPPSPQMTHLLGSLTAADTR